MELHVLIVVLMVSTPVLVINAQIVKKPVKLVMEVLLMTAKVVITGDSLNLTSVLKIVLTASMVIKVLMNAILVILIVPLAVALLLKTACRVNQEHITTMKRTHV